MHRTQTPVSRATCGLVIAIAVDPDPLYKHTVSPPLSLSLPLVGWIVVPHPSSSLHLYPPPWPPPPSPAEAPAWRLLQQQQQRSGSWRPSPSSRRYSRDRRRPGRRLLVWALVAVAGAPVLQHEAPRGAACGGPGVADVACEEGVPAWRHLAGGAAVGRPGLQVVERGAARGGHLRQGHPPRPGRRALRHQLPAGAAHRRRLQRQPLVPHRPGNVTEN